MQQQELKRRYVSPFVTIKGSARKKLQTALVERVPSYLSFYDFHTTPIQIKDPNRRITASASMFVQDYETFGDNETTSRQQTNSAILSQKGIAQSVMHFEVRMGGEIRVEFKITAVLWDDAGNAVADGELKLFEGTSESTGDLDGTRTFQLYIPAGAVVNHFVRVNNDDEGDDDYATIALTISNSGI